MFYNSTTLAGNLTREVEVKKVGNDKTLASFGLAVNKKFGDREETLFIDVTLWGKQAELAGQYLTKGQNVMIDGELKMDEWEDKNSGAKRTKISLVGFKFHFVGGKNTDNGNTTSDSGIREPVLDTSEAPF